MTKPPDKSPSQETPADISARAEAALESGDLALAQKLATSIFADPPGPWDNVFLGRIALAAEDHRAARTAFETANKQLPEEGSILVHLAEVCAVQQRWTEAVNHITTAITQRDFIAELHERRSIYLANAGDHVESIHALERALELEPNRASSWALLGERHLEHENISVAKEALDKALACDPENSTAMWNLALLAEKTGELTKAGSILTNLIDSGLVDSRIALQRRGQIRLTLGDLAGGWEDYAVRLRHAFYDSWQHALGVPYWSGDDLDGKHLVVWADQGLGEQILTAGMAQQAASRAGSISFACDPRLVALLSRSFPDIAVVSLEKLRERGKAIGPVDMQASVSELGAVLRPTMDSFPPASAYLIPDDERVSAYRKALKGTGLQSPLVGISWRSENAIAGKEKSTDLMRHWSAVLSVPSVRFVSLQYGDTDNEIAAAIAETGADIVTVQNSNPTQDIDGFAALVAAMDFVVSTSNTTVHVAGGLGIPTLAMVPMAYGRPWYWFDKGEDSPWYINLTLLRSKGDWSELAKDAAGYLERWLKS